MLFSDPAPAATGANDDKERILTEFDGATADVGWHVVNDNVMGGRSQGGFTLEQGQLHFAGRTNTDGGGFSSLRSHTLALDLSQYAGIRLRVKGDGRRYTWRLTTDAQWRGRSIGYWADFATRRGEWTVIDIPFADFTPRVRGTELAGPTLDTQRITGLGLMIYDKLDGPFELHLDSVRAYLPRAD